MSLENRQILTASLEFVYRLMVAAVPLLECAMERASGRLWSYYERHLAEEAGHDDWLRDDLAHLGATLERHYGAAQIAGSQYYLIAHEHPAALLGYLSVMESHTMSPEKVTHLEQFHHITLGCLRHHAERDPLHRRDIQEEIAALPGELQALVQWNIENVTTLLNLAFTEIEHRHRSDEERRRACSQVG